MNYYQLGGVKIKRDDLFYNAGGGSKARMLQYILADAKDYDMIVTAGGPCSNFNRACALQCAQMGVQMHLVLYTDHPEEFAASDNLFICKLAGVKTTVCKKTEVAETIRQTVESYESRGVKVKPVYGGGRSLEGIYAYYDAVKELMAQLSGSTPIDKVFVACGTGTTVSGLIAGFQEWFPHTEVHAISVARSESVEMPIIEENIKLLNSHLSTSYDLRNLHFHDQFILGEYGAVNDELVGFIKNTVSETGILIDPIYSGKALYGMSKLLDRHGGPNTLFWHTGATYTLLSNKERLLDD